VRAPKCTPLASARRYPKKTVRSLRYDQHTLTVDIQGTGFSFARVVFFDVRGFRVLDELDLYEFWPEYSEPNGWLYEVEQGGWMELESQRERFSSPSLIPELREYLLTDDQCISVLCVGPPEITDLGTDPQKQ
jgi:hypothetical protein